MLSQPQKNTYEYHLIILNVKMKVRFPCKMKLEHMGTLLTNQITSHNNVYVFNQELVLEGDQYKQVELNLNLVTQMGSKYLAGVVKISHQDMVNTEGNISKIGLARCMDNQAHCEFKVQKIIPLNQNVASRSAWNSSSKIPPGQALYKQSDFFERTPTRKNFHQTRHINARTQYDYEVEAPNRNSPDWGVNSRLEPITQKLSPKQSNLNSNRWGKSTDRNQISETQEGTYKQAYQRLKEKYKKQSEQWSLEINKRIQMENRQNSMKLELARFRMNLEERQKKLNDVSAIKQQLQGQLQEKNRLCEQLQNEIFDKNILLKDLEKEIKFMECRLEEISLEQKQVKRADMFKNRQLELRIQTLSDQLSSKNKQLQWLLKKTQKNMKNQEVELDNMRNKLRQSQSKRDELEKNLSAKSIQLQKQLNLERNKSKECLQNERSLIQKMQIDMKKLREERKQMQDKITNLQSMVQRKQYQMKMVNQQSEHLKGQIEELRQKTTKYQQLSIQNRRLNDEKRYLENIIKRMKDYQEDHESSMHQETESQFSVYKSSIEENQRKIEKLNQANNQLQRDLSKVTEEKQKLKKALVTCQQQLKQAKQLEQESKRKLHNKEKSFYSAETEHASLKQKIKNIDQIYQLEIDKVTSEHQKTQKILQSEKKKNEQNEERLKQVQIELGRRKTELLYLDDEKKKQSATMKDKYTQLESIIQDYEEKLISIERSCTHYKKSEKEAIYRMQSIQMDSLQKDDKIQKLKKQIKILSQKCSQYEQVLQMKVCELVEVTEQRDSLAESYNKTDSQLKQTYSQLEETNDIKVKLKRDLQVLKDELSMLKSSYKIIQERLNQKQSKQDSMNLELRSYITERNSYELKVGVFRKEGSRFKRQISQLISKNQSITTKCPKSQIDLGYNGSEDDQFNFNEFFSTLNVHFKEVRQYCQRQKQQMEKLQNEIKVLQNDKQRIIGQKQLRQQTLKSQLSLVEDEFETMLEEKKAQIQKYSQIISELHQRIQQSENNQNQLNIQLEQLTFTISSTKLDAQAVKNEVNQRINQLKQYNNQLQEKNNELQGAIQELQTKIDQCECEIAFVNANFEEQIQSGARKDNIIMQLKEEIELMRLTLEGLKNSKKQLKDKVDELQMKLADKTDENENLQRSLMQDESKYTQLKQFVSKMIKEKQMAIKKQLEMGEEMMKLESSTLIKGKQLQILCQQYERIKSNNEILKQNNQKLTITSKSLQQEVQFLRVSLKKNQEKSTQLETNLKSKQIELKQLEVRLKVITEKNRKQICGLQDQMEILQHKFDSENRILQNNNFQLTEQLQKSTENNKKLENKIQEDEIVRFEQHQKIVNFEQDLHEKTKEIDDLKSKIQSLDSNINELNEELRVSQEKMFDLSGKKFNLETMVRSVMEQKQQQLQTMNEQFTNKYESMCQQYEYKVEMMSKQKQYFRKELQDKQRQLMKKNIEVKNCEERQMSSRKKYQQKIKKIDQQRLNFNSTKNQQLQKSNDENRQLNDNLNKKQVQNRRLSSQVDTLRRSITNLEIKMKQYDSKLDSEKRQHAAEVEMMKKKQIQNRNFRENVSSRQWSLERQVKKMLQNLTRNYLELHDPTDSNRVVQLIRSFQSSIVEVIALKNDNL